MSRPSFEREFQRSIMYTIQYRLTILFLFEGIIISSIYINNKVVQCERTEYTVVNGRDVRQVKREDS